MIKKRFLVVTFAILAMAAGSSAWAQQFARPNSTTNNGGWTVVNAATHHGAVGEVTANNNDYINSGNGLNSTVIMTLSGVSDPGGANQNDHILRFHCRSLGSGGPERCNVAVYDGGTQIFDTGNNSANRDAFALYEFTIPDASAITNYSNLTVQITSTSLGGSESVQVSWVELQVPGVSATAPLVTTIAATGRTQSQATLGGNVSSDGNSSLTGVGVYYSTTSGFTPPGQGTQLPMAIQPVPGNFTGNLTDLPSGTTYYYRAYATNAIGERIATNEVSFTTKDFPVMVATPTVTIDSPTSATLGGEMTSNGFDAGGVTDCGVEWGTAPGGPYTQVSAGICTENNAFFAPQLTGLTTGQDYYFRSYAINSVGTGYSSERNFKPVDTPSVTGTVDLPSITDATALLGGDITDTGGDTVTAVGIIWDFDIDPVNGGVNVPMTVNDPFSQTVTGLPAGTDLWFVAYASNGAGPGYSTPVPFTTAIGAPTMNPTPTVTGIDVDRATLGGTMTSDGGGSPSCGVEWSTTAGGPYGNSQAVACTEAVPFSTEVTGLTTGTTYYFRAFATSAQGTDYSDEDFFVPQGAPVVTASVTNILLESALLQGNVTNSGGSAIIERGFYWNTASPAQAGTKEIVGSGTGAYSKALSGLPVGGRIYYEAYATNATQTGYSGEQFFDTLSEPTVQASNVTFPKESGRAMRISWTRGNGSGVIVVFRLSGTGRVDPADSDDYLANSNFGLAPELPPNSNNFVVYKGKANSVLVNGLTENTAYSVVVYEYGGTGANTNYLLVDAPSATNTGTQSTSNVPVHNMDNAVNCDNCHKHNAFGTLGDAGLIVSCQYCHSNGQVAQTKQEFSNHLTPTKNQDGVTYVDCGTCHELHNPGGENTTLSYNPLTTGTTYNKSFLRANVNKYIPGAVNGAFLHNDQPKRELGNPSGYPETPADTPERAVEGGTSAASRGYCQICHTYTDHHTNDPDITGSNQCHDGNTGNCGPQETHCGECHEHNDSFRGKGGSTTCMVCHASSQQETGLSRRPIMPEFDYPATVASTHIYADNSLIEENDCKVCHDFDTHKQQSITVKNLDGGANVSQASSDVSAQTPAEGAPLSAHCLSCHDDGVPSAMVDSGNQTKASPFTGSASAQTRILNGGNTSLWTNAGHNAAPTVGCVGCHVGHGSTQVSLLNPVAPTFSAGGVAGSFRTNFCINCHDADGPSSRNVAAQFNNGTNYTVTGMNGQTNNQRHDVVGTTPAVGCGDCHKPHADNSTNPVRNPETGLMPTYSGTGSWNGINYALAGNLNPASPQGGGSVTEPDYIQFCLVCHDGTPYGGSSAAYDIGSSYLTSRGGKQHGNGEGGSGTSTAKGNLKPPWTTQADYLAGRDPSAPYAALNCTTCHGPHGTGNIYNLKTSITVAGTQMSIGGQAGSQFAAFSGTTYTLPLDAGNQRSDRYGAWCTFCHNMNAHAGVDETTACNSGHRHGGNNF
ncbi:MAG TPA: hypothetical protein VIS31_13010 [Woeseiaceae bacterium]